MKARSEAAEPVVKNECEPISEVFEIGILDENGKRIGGPIDAWSSRAWPWQVRPVPPDSEEKGFYARTINRQVFYHGANMEEAIGNMLQSICELGRKGSVDPSQPKRPGVGGLQHVLELLEEELQYLLERRREFPEFHSKNFEDPSKDGREALKDPQFLRTNDIISGIATAISTLARVKEL